MNHSLALFRVPGDMTSSEVEVMREDLKALAFRHNVELELFTPIVDVDPPAKLSMVFAGIRAKWALARAARRTAPRVSL